LSLHIDFEKKNVDKNFKIKKHQCFFESFLFSDNFHIKSVVHLKMSDRNFLGRGGYGTVTKRGDIAVKKLKQLNHLIQEYCVGKHLKSCPYVVQIIGADFENCEIHMKLYNGSLNHWMVENRTFEQKLFVVKEIISALCWINDVGLVHGDIKPGNILVNWDRRGDANNVVLGDVGFLSTEDHSKCGRTTRTYQEKSPEADWKHDIYSLGIIITELIGTTKVSKKEKPEPEHVQSVAKERIKDENILKWTLKMLSEDRDERPTARSLLRRLFDISPPIRYHPGIPMIKNKIDEDDLDEAQRFFKSEITVNGKNIVIKRAKIAHEAFLVYINKRSIKKEQFILHAHCMFIIFSSLFGKSGFTDKIVAKKTKTSEKAIHRILMGMINDEDVMNVIFYTKKGCVAI
jgi:serine/threonine protein kinase